MEEDGPNGGEGGGSEARQGGWLCDCWPVPLLIGGHRVTELAGVDAVWF